MIKVLFFGPLRDIVGAAHETYELSGPATLGALFDVYAARFPGLAELRRNIVFARNLKFSDPASALADGDEVAFLPPVSGGCDAECEIGHEQIYCALTRDPVDARALAARTRQDIDGAVVVFEGVVRNNNEGKRVTHLEYECYDSMAIRSMATLAMDLTRRHEITRIGIVHRLGQVSVGEASIVVAVAAPHRKPAFAAATEAMDRVKAEVAVWKKEYFEEGAAWVEGTRMSELALK